MANERGIGPSALNQILNNRSLRLGAGLATAVAIPVAVLFYFQFRSLHDLEQTSAVVLRQLSHESADVLARNIDANLKAPQINVLLRITQAHSEPLDLDFMDPVLRAGLNQSPYIDEYYVWSAESHVHRNELLVYDRSASSRPAADRFRRSSALERLLVPRLRALAEHRRAIVTLLETIDGEPRYIQAQLRFNNASREKLTSFIAFSVGRERIRREFFPEFLASKLPTLHGATGFPPLVVTLLDDAGAVIYNSGMEATHKFIDEREFPLVFFDRELLQYAAPYETHREIWKLRVGYGNQEVAAIVKASTRPQILLMTMLAVGMALGVFFVAGAAAREVRLAELKSNFVSSVSHDLKTPLALIQLFAETLELGRLKSTDRAQEYYRIINNEARKLTRLIDNILDFSKMEAGLRPYRTTPADLGEITEEVLAALDSQFAQSQFTVRREIETRMPAVLVDVEAVKRAIENLLTNAMKYSGGNRDILVRVGVERGQAFVAVTDSGIGIPRRLQRKIFRKFFRIEQDAVTGPQGTGLGLAIVDHTMRGHRGRVRIESDPGRGSTFTLCFPIPSGVKTDEAHSGDRGRAADAARPA